VKCKIPDAAADGRPRGEQPKAIGSAVPLRLEREAGLDTCTRVQAANPYASGAGGPDFERRVAAAFVCCALSGTPIPPLACPATTIRLQAAHRDWGFDDIVLEAASGAGKRQRVFVSVKSTISPRASDPEFADVISKAWSDWQPETGFDRHQDAFLLAAATLRSPRIHLLAKLTDIARASPDRADFELRLSRAGYHHSSVRELRPEIAGIIQKETQAPPEGEELRRFLSHLFVSTFDFDQEASQDKARVLGLLRLASPSRDAAAADACWNAVFERISLGAAKGEVFMAAEFESIARQHGLQVDTPARMRTWLANLRAHCRLTRSGITSLLCANQRHLARERPLEDLREALSAGQFTLVTGPAGSGKSALAAEAAEAFARPENVFCFQSEELAHPHLDAALQTGGLRDLNAEEWTDALPFEPRVLVIEALERLLQSTGSQEALTQLLRVVSADRRWRVIVTCRDYLADHVRDTWGVPGGWAVVHVPLLEAEELAAAVSDSGIPDIWLEQPAVRDALRNLKWLDLTMRAAQRIKGPIPSSAWATLADWRGFVWRQLLKPEVDSSGQELLVRIAIQRATSGSPWITVDSPSLAVADQLRAQGILRQNDLFLERYRPEHDLLEDWALLVYVRREFADHSRQPAELFERLGDHLMVRRAFRQFFGELLEGDKGNEGVAFIRQVFTEARCGRQWREEVAIAMLGSACAVDALRQTQDLWTDAPGEGLHMLYHVLRIAYLGKPPQDGEPERPFGPGWNAVMTFIQAQGEGFLREHTRNITALLLDWHHAVTPECSAPQGLASAAALVRGLWQIATEGGKRFEQYWTADEWHHASASENRLCWLVASVAGALDPQFFREVGREVFGKRDRDIPAGAREKHRQGGDLAEFLVTDHAGWTLARAHPRAMARLCLQAYGLGKRRDRTRGGRFGMCRSCGLTANPHDFTPPSALRGPFLELLREHRALGEALILRLVNEAAYHWAQGVEAIEPWEQSFEVTLRIDGERFSQIADQGWWRCYRGWSPYHPVLECALMALEKWLLEDVAARELENLQETLLRLVGRSINTAITAVAASVGEVHWWHCGKLAAVLLACRPLLELDRHRWMNDQTQSGWGGGWPGRNTLYLQERRESNALPHRQEHLEDFILKAQLGPGRAEIWPVIDRLKAELAGVPPEETTDEVQTARLILHRIDSRNLKFGRRESAPGQILIQPGPPPADLQKHLEEFGKEMEANWLPMEMQMWASQILNPMGSAQPQPQRWREMLEKARKLHAAGVEPERMLVFGGAPTLVAAVCLRDFLAELAEDELEWCIAQVAGILHQQSDLTEWQPGSLLTAWQAEAAAARACGILAASRQAKPAQMAAIDEATAIALSHPEKGVRLAAAEGLGRAPSDSGIQLAACELLILHSRCCRNIDLRHRGPQRLPYEHIQTWQDRCSAMHSEILAETRTLRERFVRGEAPDLGRLALFYPHGQEEEQNLPVLLAALLHHSSTTAAAVFVRVRNWLSIQLIDEAHRWHGCRKFAADAWRDHHGSLSRGDPVNTGEVGHLLARRVLAMAPAEARGFYAPVLQPSRICHLRSKAGEFLKHLCLMLEEAGEPGAFWAAWEEYVRAAVEVGSQIQNEEHWRALRVPPKAPAEAFGALLSAVFLNHMYFRVGQKWPHLDGQAERFAAAFRAFHAFALNDYISFLGTIGGSLLPGAWRGLSDCVRTLIQRAGKPLLTRTSQVHLLRLIAQEASLRRVPDGDRDTWRSMLHLLDVLADAGFAEAFRLRESLARFAA